MSEHYYSPQPTVKSEPRAVTFQVRGIELQLQTDAGVFSKVGLDFGTRLLIETVDLPETGQIVDLGCGYGPVGAVLARVFPKTHWQLLDINQRAVELATENTASLRPRVEVRQSDGLSALGSVVPDVILLNPPIRAGKQVVYGLFAEACARLRRDGGLWVVIHKKHGAQSAGKYLSSLFADVDVAAKKSGYQVLKCQFPKFEG